jgi:hypothetical protein
MEVRHVWVGVHAWIVYMLMLMAGGSSAATGMFVIVMTVVMSMFVFVIDGVVVMDVLVVTAQHQPHPDDAEHQRRKLTTAHRLREHRPRHDRADERGRGEHQLPASGTEITCTTA